MSGTCSALVHIVFDFTIVGLRGFNQLAGQSRGIGGVFVVDIVHAVESDVGCCLFALSVGGAVVSAFVGIGGASSGNCGTSC